MNRDDEIDGLKSERLRQHFRAQEAEIARLREALGDLYAVSLKESSEGASAIEWNGCMANARAALKVSEGV